MTHPQSTVSTSDSGTRLARDLFLSAVMLLVSIGTVMVFSASAFHWTAGDDSYLFLRRQLLWLPIAALGCILFANLSPRLLRRYYWQPLVICAVLLVAVILPHIGRNVNAARRWLPLGSLQFQPSELAKIAAVLFVAGFTAADPTRPRKFFRGFLVVTAAILPIFLLIVVEPDLGTSVFVLGLTLCMLFLSGTPTWFFLVSGLIFAPLIGVFMALRWEEVSSRLLGFLEPEKLYQVQQSLTALGSGGWLGSGLGAGSQKLRFLPEPHTDFIFAIIGEELGWVGCAAILLLFLLLLWSGVRVVARFRDPFSFLVGAGTVVSLAAQAAINIAVVTASAPTKGIALPFITFGGSGLCVTMAQVGILLALERERRLGAVAPAPGPAARPALRPAEEVA